MRNKRKARSGRKQILCSFIKFAVAQIVILLFFVAMLDMSRSPDPSDLKQVDIVVDQVHYAPFPRIIRFSIFAGTEKYSFSNTGKIGEHSNSELYDAVSVGDKLSITYYEDTHLFRKVNWVVSAWDETTVYRSTEAYLESTEGAWIGVCVIFGVIELAFVGVLIAYCWLHKKEIKKALKATTKKDK